jgi:hypothetical protein
MRWIRSVFEFLDNFYPKFDDNIRQRTPSGGLLALLSFVAMSVLLWRGFRAWVSAAANQRFVIDTPPLPTSSNGRIDPDRLPKMDINFDVFVTHMPCAYLHIDVIDTIKESDHTAHGRVRMERFDTQHHPIYQKIFMNDTESLPANYCGPCYSVSLGCCNSCKDVRRAFKLKRRPLPALATIEQCVREGYADQLKSMANESCRIHGSLAVHLHPGTLHIAPGDSYNCAHDHLHAYEKLGIDVGAFNMSHKINHFSLGLPQTKGHFPLDGTEVAQTKNGRLKMFYFVRAVPIGNGTRRFAIGASSYQNYRGSGSTKFPGIFFVYDISPITVIQEAVGSMMEFLVEISAILGGVFATATLLDAIAFRFIGGDPQLPKAE